MLQKHHLDLLMMMCKDFHRFAHLSLLYFNFLNVCQIVFLIGYLHQLNSNLNSKSLIIYTAAIYFAFRD